MGTETNAHIERLVEVQRDGWAKLVHGFALQADEDGDGIAMFLDSDAFRFDPGCDGLQEAARRSVGEVVTRGGHGDE